MAISVTNLTLKQQTGTDNTYFATWEPPVSTVTTTTSTTAVSKGSLVSIQEGATYYNGTPIPSWVLNQKWYVCEISGDRAVINKNEAGTSSIMSPINVRYLTTGSASSGLSTTTTEKVSNIDKYKVVWKYATGDEVWFAGSSEEIAADEIKVSTYSPPEQAYRISIWVTPISKTYTENNTTVSYWTGTAAQKDLYLSTAKPTKPSTPTVELDKYWLEAYIENISDSRTDQIEFEVYDNDTKFTSGVVTVLTARAIFRCSVNAGAEYRVRCRAINTTGGKSYSEWSDYTSSVKTIPDGVSNIKTEADTKTSVKLTWDTMPTATSYTVEYTTKKEYFDSSNSVSSMTVESSTAYISGIESGNAWYFRVKASNDAGDSGWSDIVSAIVGTKPEPPTTWSLSTIAIVGEDIILYWTHNSEDGSKQKEAQIYLNVSGEGQFITVTSTIAEDEDEPVYSYTISSKDYTDGGEILWRVKTKGVADDYSDWSTQRTIKLYAPPTVSLKTSITDGAVTSLPLSLTATTGPSNQTPLSYYIAVESNDSYETVNNTGSTTQVIAGTDIYSQTVISSDSTFAHNISAGDITMSVGHSYTLKVLVAMDSGLAATAEISFDVNWEVKSYICDASVTVDKSTLSAYIAPFCLGENDDLVSNVTLAVYRREADGTFTEIGSNLANNMVTTVTDPHPSLDYARYRIVATDISTGAIDYSDLPGQPINEPSIVIQWAEKWTAFDYAENSAPDVSPWTGSMVRLPYNVDVTEESNPDVSLIEYIGRKNPVSYYGTQRGESGTWSTEIDKRDAETIYALRRLKAWSGNVYVREPSGIGYWANINVSMSRKHLVLTIPVSLKVTRVEGGI